MTLKKFHIPAISEKKFSYPSHSNLTWYLALILTSLLFCGLENVLNVNTHLKTNFQNVERGLLLKVAFVKINKRNFGKNISYRKRRKNTHNY